MQVIAVCSMSHSCGSSFVVVRKPEGIHNRQRVHTRGYDVALFEKQRIYGTSFKKYRRYKAYVYPPLPCVGVTWKCQYAMGKMHYQHQYQRNNLETKVFLLCCTYCTNYIYDKFISLSACFFVNYYMNCLNMYISIVLRSDNV